MACTCKLLLPRSHRGEQLLRVLSIDLQKHPFTCDEVTRNEAATIFTLFICVTVVRHNSAPAAALGTSRRCRSLDSSVGLPTSLTRPRPLLRYSPRRAGASPRFRSPCPSSSP